MFMPIFLKLACLGGAPLSAPLLSLSPASIDPKSKEILVKPTLQITDPAFPHVFAIGDVAAARAHKASGPGHRQADVAVQNMVQMIAGGCPRAVYVPAAPHIRLSLGLVRYRSIIGWMDTMLMRRASTHT
jgi:NADH dehydrogenase FAD-containing subunit